MIIKRNLKSQMPSLKRCRLSDPVGKNDECSATRKKRKTNNNGYYPLNLLGDVAAGVIPVSFHGLLSAASVVEKGFAASWCTEVTCSPGREVESKKEEGGGGGGSDVVPARRNRPAEVQRPPLVRTSRGRVQVLPSRFNDSVIDNWRKESKNSLRDYDLDDEFDCKNERFGVKAPKSCNQNAKKGRNDEKTGHKHRKYSALCEGEARDYCKGFGVKKHSRREVLVEDERGRFVEVEGVELMESERVLKENGERRSNGLYGPEDFYAGDIVWAKAGKKEPFWPAIVIDPMTQAPDLVLRSCIADAACVMFLGYAGNENQRVCNMNY